MFSSVGFVVSSHTFRSLIHFEFLFMYSVRESSNFTLLFLNTLKIFFIYFTLAVLSLCSCVGFSLVVTSRVSFLVVCDEVLLILGASLVEHRL